MDRRRRSGERRTPGAPGVLSVLGPASGSAAAAPSPAYGDKGVALRRHRIALPSGVQSGDVTSHEAVLWARGDAEGRLVARLSSGAHVGRVLHGPHVDQTSDFTGRLDLTGLHPGRGYDAAVWFEGLDGTRGEVGHVHFRTAAPGRRPTSFVWAGGSAADGYGINPETGGMTGYAAVHTTNPDFLVHAGGVRPDQVLPEEVVEPDGRVWRNRVTPEVLAVAETVDQFRGRHRYHLLDDHVRALAADVPTVALWDDHETHLGWLPDALLDDDRYDERRTDVLAARARRAWQEYRPVASQAVHMRGSDGFASARLYRRIERGPLLDLFCLDLRRDPRGPDGPAETGTPADGEPERLPVLGHEQTEWLLREAAASRATWKVLLADEPVGRAARDDPDHELPRLLRGLRDRGVRNLVWLTSGVRWAAAHAYDPEQAACGGFDPLREFVAGPIHAAAAVAPGGSSDRGGPTDPADAGPLPPTVGWARGADVEGESPRAGHQWFGHIAIASDATLTVSLRDARGQVAYSEELGPERS